MRKRFNFAVFLLFFCVLGAVLGEVEVAGDAVSSPEAGNAAGQWFRSAVDMFKDVASDDAGRAMLIINGVIAFILLLFAVVLVRSSRKQKKTIAASKREVDDAMRQLAADRLAAMTEINNAIDRMQAKCRETVDDTAAVAEQMRQDSKESVAQAKAAIKGVKLAWTKIQEWEKASQQKFAQIDRTITTKLGEIDSRAASVTKDMVKQIADKADFQRKLMKMWKYAIETTAKKEHQKACDALELANQLWDRINKEYPGTHEAFNNWGGILLEQAKTDLGDEREKLLTEAVEKLMTSESVKPGAAAYNLACVYAVMDNYDQSRKWLETGAKAGTLETREHAMQDTDLKPFWREDWFRKLDWK
ncbi:MAG: hypothetical protein KAS23_16165 [Anaerohalosphaera sp.]|nr:hypothetical protein [Anaerohalosphaera sp.]